MEAQSKLRLTYGQLLQVSANHVPIRFSTPLPKGKTLCSDMHPFFWKPMQFMFCSPLRVLIKEFENSHLSNFCFIVKGRKNNFLKRPTQRIKIFSYCFFRSETIRKSCVWRNANVTSLFLINRSLIKWTISQRNLTFEQKLKDFGPRTKFQKLNFICPGECLQICWLNTFPELFFCLEFPPFEFDNLKHREGKIHCLKLSQTGDPRCYIGGS